MSPRSLQEFFARRGACGEDPHLPSVDFGLIHNIMVQQPRSTVDSLMAFCRDPHNLGRFLPDPRDRKLFSGRLVKALSEFRGKAGSGTC